VALGFYFLENVYDFPVGANQEGGSGNSHHRLAIHVFLFHHVVGGTDCLVGVGEQGIRELVFFLEFLLLCRRIGGNTEDYRSGLLDFFVCVTEPGRLYRSTGRVGLRVEEQDHGFAAKVLQRYLLAILIRQSEVRGFIIDLHAFFFLW
jgi:hypothetical protein